MPTIEITAEQRERLEDVRVELEEHRLGPYGTIREVDAIEFLLDHYETGAEPGRSDADGAPQEDAADDDDEGSENKEEAEDGNDENGDDGEADGNEEEESSEDGNDENGDGSGRLNAMMQLLEEHDGKWEESDSEDGKYTVTLPDDTTENVRTKDDVRALLFKHY